MGKFKYCLVQYLAWLVDKRKHKTIFDCKDCPIKDGCKKKGDNDGTDKTN